MFLEIFLKIESIPYILKALTLVVGSQKLLIFLSGFTKIKVKLCIFLIPRPKNGSEENLL